MANFGPSCWRLSERRKIFEPPRDDPLWRSHAQGPTVLPVSRDRWMVWVAGRDAQNRSRIYALELDPGNLAVGQVHRKPALDPGAQGHFDCFGVGPGTVVADGDRLRLYYTGAGPAPGLPYLSAIGVAESDDGGRSFTRLGDAPVLGKSPHDPHGVATPTVFRRRDRWVMWYSSFRDWRVVDGKPEPLYDIRSARSGDGLTWTCDDGPVLDFADNDEGGLVRAQVFDATGAETLIAASRGWRNFRAGEGDGYRFVGARPTGEGTWERCGDCLAFDPPPDPGDWDGDMQCYPWVVEDGDRRMVFYNGNDFGRFGFGCARLVNSETAP